jgi:hypothetical protein
MVRERAREAVQMVCRGRGRRPVSSCGVGSDVIDAQSSSAWVGECALVAGRVVWERNVPCTLGALAWVGWSLGRDPKSTTAVSTMVRGSRAVRCDDSLHAAQQNERAVDGAYLRGRQKWRR